MKSALLKKYFDGFSVAIAAVALTSLSLSACGVLPKLPAYTATNISIIKPDGTAQEHKQTKANIYQDTIATSGTNGNAKRNVFIGIAISGGGTRAANFSASVLQELENLGILDQTAAISSVSGGSLTTAYFGLYGAFPSNRLEVAPEDNISGANRQQFWASLKNRLAIDFRTEWVKKYLLPHNLFLTATTNLDRTDLLAEVFDETLFDSKTFGDLPPFGLLSPKILLNATMENNPKFLGTEIATRRGDSVTAQYSGFTFSEEGFSAIGSELSKYSIARAVAASAAFPGVFNSTTLNTFRNTRGGITSDAPSGYLHLIDGGPSDNLGVDAIVQNARNVVNFWTNSEAAPFNGCLLILVDAYAGQTASQGGAAQADLRGFVSHFVDLNFIDASDALLQRRREDTLEQFGVPLSVLGDRFPESYVADTPGLLQRWVPAVTFVNESVHISQGSKVIFDNDHRPSLKEFATTLRNARERRFSCAVWHISLDEVRSIGMTSKEGMTDQEAFNSSRTFAKLPIVQTRNQIWEITSRIKTDFDLSGPRGCSRELLQQALWDAGRIAVRDDLVSRNRICQWMLNHGIAPLRKCIAEEDQPLVRDYPVRAVLDKNGNDLGIECVAPDQSHATPRVTD